MIEPDVFGCFDASCPFHSRFGMHTNGGCTCTCEAFPDPEQRRLVDRMLRKAREVAEADGRLMGQRDAPEVAVMLHKFLARVLDLPKREARRVVEAELKRLEDVRALEASRDADEKCCPKCFAPSDLTRGPAGVFFECGSIDHRGLFIRDEVCVEAEKAYLRGLRHRGELG